MFKLEDFKPGELLYIRYIFDSKGIHKDKADYVYICKVYKTESGSKTFKNKIWVNDIWSGDGILDEKKFIYLDDFNAFYADPNEESSIYILIDKYHHPDLSKLIGEQPEDQEVLNFIKAIYPEHFV